MPNDFSNKFKYFLDKSVTEEGVVLIYLVSPSLSTPREEMGEYLEILPMHTY